MADSSSTHNSGFFIYNPLILKGRIEIPQKTLVTISVAKVNKRSVTIYVAEAKDIYVSSEDWFDAFSYDRGFKLKQSDYSAPLPTRQAIKAYTTAADTYILIWEDTFE